MRKISLWLRLPLLILGTLSFFINERYLSTESFFVLLRYVSLALVGLSAGLSLVMVLAEGSNQRGEKKSFAYALAWQIFFLVALVLYIAYGSSLKGAPAPENLVQKILLASWLICLFLSLFSAVGVEWAIRQTGLADHAEPHRVAKAGLSMLSIGILLCALGALNFAGVQKNISRDWSYLKVNTPSESTFKMITRLSEPITIALYYPPTNEVLGIVKEYFSALKAKQPLINIEYYDKDMHPTKAEAHRIQRNGQILLELNQRRSTIDTGLTLSKARRTLKSIDKEFQKSFLEITSSRKTIYFTRGHGEMSWLGDSNDNPTRSLRAIEAYLRSQNFSVRFLGINEGSTTAVPDDASVVVIAGPTEPFLKEEVEVLNGYAEKGGKIMAFLDVQGPTGELQALAPTGQNPLYEWLKETGINFVQTPLANDKNFVPVSRSDADHWFIFSNMFTSHESVINLARNDDRLALLIYAGGYLVVSPEKGKWKTYETVRSDSNTFNDENRNYKLDADEKRNSYIVGAITEIKNAQPGDPNQNNEYGRIVVVADANFVSDLVATNSQGNAIFFADSLKWLVGDTAISGEVASEEDVKIRHTNTEETKWFYGTVILVPLLVLGAGFIATRRRTDTVKEVGNAG
jgi:hypothetical protein